ncbi:hypothetical protein CW362_37795 [Streptomyces populi]|uniref:Uncharacterized protein n=1 Tax=Streptomyces populi TaxID=2058924 RepID=A0A2I0SDE1_9ACTN|nr:hypothetical protein [Streptomyces populi]PKT67929.1 hypothetical protein CW362_37795 [Streptomyces populi]
MHEESSEFGSIESANFSLWSPVCRQDGSDVSCRFDVTSPEFLGINQADSQLLQGFVQAMDVCTGTVEKWSVQRFVTPYYTYSTDTENWQDAFRLAWRVTLSISGASRYRQCGKVGPYPADGLDSTWTDELSILPLEQEEVVIIANEGPVRDISFLEERSAGRHLEEIEYDFPDSPVRQVRYHLGAMHLPTSIDAVRQILDQCRPRFMVSHSSVAAGRSAWQVPAGWTEIR